jgi:hypothetical protein
MEKVNRCKGISETLHQLSLFPDLTEFATLSGQKLVLDAVIVSVNASSALVLSIPRPIAYKLQ